MPPPHTIVFLVPLLLAAGCAGSGSTTPADRVAVVVGRDIDDRRVVDAAVERLPVGTPVADVPGARTYDASPTRTGWWSRRGRPGVANVGRGVGRYDAASGRPRG